MTLSFLRADAAEQLEQSRLEMTLVQSLNTVFLRAGAAEQLEQSRLEMTLVQSLNTVF